MPPSRGWTPGAMAAWYAPDAQFDDEVFSLRGQAPVGGMWRMLCEATQARHRDRFDFWVWSRQAPGIPGPVLGRAPPFRRKVRT